MRTIHICAVLVAMLSSQACTKDKGFTHGGNYPAAVGRLILSSCAISGCHNNHSRSAAAGLSLSDWNHLMEGGRSGPVIIPYSPEFSTICYYTNTFSDLGPSLKPLMPLNQQALSREDYLLLRDWILQGAPDINGQVFGGDPQVPKIYIANQLCDVVSILDGATKLPIRYVNVGATAAQEFPVQITVAPDNRSWYVAFLASGILQQFSVSGNVLTGQAELGEGEWSSFGLTPDSKFAYCVDHSFQGQIKKVELSSMKVIQTIAPSDMQYPRSVVVGEDHICIGAENGNSIFVAGTKDTALNFTRVSLDGTPPHYIAGLSDPWVLTKNTTNGHVFVGCVSSGEIIEVDPGAKSVSGRIHLGVAPAAMVFDPFQQQIWVSSMTDSISFPGHVGSVKIVDAKTMTLIKTVKAGYQSNGLALVPRYNYVAVVNSNISGGGPAPHHVSGCGGRNGYVSFLDHHSFAVLPNRYELAVYPSAAAVSGF